MQEAIIIGKEQVPSLGLGTYQLRGKDGERAIAFAISKGYRHIDTAQFYRNEDTLGDAVRHSGIDRKEFFITTKVWPTDFTKRNFVPSVEESLKELETDYVDLLLLHWPAEDTTNDRAVEFLLECQHKKYARLIGVSNFSIAQLERARKNAPIFCNQVQYHPYINQRDMANYTAANNLLLTAYSPLALGKVNKDKVLIQLAEKYGKNPSQLVLRWLLQQKNVSPIPKAGSEKHIIENTQVFDFTISDEDMQSIFNISN
jgi:2,5-diketo-D-gluconate reductase B